MGRKLEKKVRGAIVAWAAIATLATIRVDIHVVPSGMEVEMNAHVIIKVQHGEAGGHVVP